MEDFITRLQEEKAQLDDRLGKLSGSIDGGKILTIDTVQQSLLRIQAEAMRTYSECLYQRLQQLSDN